MSDKIVVWFQSLKNSLKTLWNNIKIAEQKIKSIISNIKPIFIILKSKDDLIRLWVDKNMKPYKVELRLKNFQGYLNVDEFLERLIIKPKEIHNS